MFKPRRQSHKWKLLQQGFLPFEAHSLSGIKRDTSYYKKMVKERKELFRRAMDDGWTRREYGEHIKGIYADKNWFITKGQVESPWATRKKSVGKADCFQMLKEYRDKAIKAGEYTPKPKVKKKKPGEREISKGDVQEQKRRHREKQREKAPQPYRIKNGEKIMLSEKEFKKRWDDWLRRGSRG